LSREAYVKKVSTCSEGDLVECLLGVAALMRNTGAAAAAGTLLMYPISTSLIVTGFGPSTSSPQDPSLHAQSLPERWIAALNELERLNRRVAELEGGLRQVDLRAQFNRVHVNIFILGGGRLV
jgi:hypothetical protein